MASVNRKRIIIRDEKLAQAVSIYEDMLLATKDVVRDDMTEGIWLKAIERAGDSMIKSIIVQNLKGNRDVNML